MSDIGAQGYEGLGLGFPEPWEDWDDNYFDGLSEQLAEVLARRATPTRAEAEAETDRLWRACVLRTVPAARLRPAYRSATDALAEAIRRQWRPSSSDLHRLAEMGRGDPASAGWLLIFSVLDATAPGPVPVVRGDQYHGSRPIAYDYSRRLVAHTLRSVRNIVRGSPEPDALSLLRSIERNARDLLRKSLEERLCEQWKRAVKEGGIVLEVADLTAAVHVVSPPSPREVTTLYPRTLDALVSALARTWSVRKERPNDRETLRRLVVVEQRSEPEMKRELCRHGLLSALADRKMPQRIRRQDGYLQAGQQLIPNEDVPLREFLRWLRNEAILRASRELRERAPKKKEMGWSESPVGAAVVEAAVIEPDPRVDLLFAAARDDLDRQLVEYRLEGYNVREAAEMMNEAEPKVQKRWQRLQGRARSATG